MFKLTYLCICENKHDRNCWWEQVCHMLDLVVRVVKSARSSSCLQFSVLSGIVQYIVALLFNLRFSADPDMLEVGNGGMTLAEYRSHFSIWALMKVSFHWDWTDVVWPYFEYCFNCCKGTWVKGLTEEFWKNKTCSSLKMIIVMQVSLLLILHLLILLLLDARKEMS